MVEFEQHTVQSHTVHLLGYLEDTAVCGDNGRAYRLVHTNELSRLESRTVGRYDENTSRQKESAAVMLTHPRSGPQ